MRYAFVFTLFMLLSLCLKAQYENRFWYFGVQDFPEGLDFRNNSPAVVKDGKIAAEEGCATISDLSGNLLFYTNGEQVWNRRHEIMRNGSSLGGSADAEQAALIVKKPDSKGIYYIFTTDGRTQEFSYSMIDMSLQGGLGEVTSGHNVLHASNFEAITATRHCNGRDVWVITRRVHSGTFATYLVSPSGISAAVESSTAAHVPSFTGYMKVSPDGRKLADLSYSGSRAVGLYDFDNSSGKVTRERAWLETSDKFKPLYALEFSPDGTKLYCSGDQLIYQMEIDLTNTPAIENSITSFKGGPFYVGGLQLGPDGKIYVANMGSTYLGVINLPNKKGTASDYKPEAIQFADEPSINIGLPNFICSDFNRKHRPFYINQFCDQRRIELWVANSANFDTVHWQIRDGNGQYITTLYGDGATYTYTGPGEYRIRLEYTENCSYAYIDTAIFILDNTKPDFLGPDTLLCAGTSLVLDLSRMGRSFQWSNGSTDPTLSINSPGQYWVKLTTDCALLTDTINVSYQLPVDYLPEDTTICYGAEYRIVPKAKGDAYLWSTGSTDSAIVVKEPGEYSLKVLRGHCWEEDKTSVKQYPGLWTALGDEYFICEDDSELVRLDAGKDFTSYLWRPTGDTTQWIIVSKRGPYYVSVADFRGCTGEDGTIVQRRCPVTAAFPNAFSPNGDGLNDTFKAVGENITGIELMVYNAWGEEVFRSYDPSTGWDGTFKGREAPLGIYIYRSTVEGYGKSKHRLLLYRKGTVSLIR